MILNIDFTMRFLDNMNPYIFEIPTYIQLILMVGGIGTIILINQWEKFKRNYITFFGLESSE